MTSQIAEIWEKLRNIYKRLKTPCKQEIVSASSLIPKATTDLLVVTSLGEDLTIENWTGVISDGQAMLIKILDDGTTRALTFGTDYREIGITLPTATTAGKWVYIFCIYSSADSKIDVLSVQQEA
jgi:hypothetical protein